MRKDRKSSSEVKTQQVNPAEIKASLWIELSNRVALVERRLIEHSDKLDQMYLRFMEERRKENELSRELASSTVNRLTDSVQALIEKRDQIRAQRPDAKTKTELLMLNMMEDEVEMRIERARADLERARIVINTKDKEISESQRNIKAIKDQPKSAPAQPLRFGSWMWFQDKFLTNGLQVVWIALLLAFMQLGVIPVFQFLLELLTKAFGGE